MLICLINILKGLLVLRQYPWFCSDCLVHLWCYRTVMMMAQPDSWEHDFLREGMVMSPEKGLYTVFPHLPAPTVCLREKKRMISGGPQEASVGDYFSNCCKCGTLISQDKSKLERRAVYWSTRNVDSLVKWKKMAFILPLFKFQVGAFDMVVSFKDLS